MRVLNAPLGAMARRYGVMAALLSSACVQLAFADGMIRTRYSHLGQTTESTIYTHDDRQRIESPGTIMIRQGDRKRMIQLDPQTNTYTAFSLSGPAAPANETSTAAPAKKGGTVDFTTTVTDTSERKTILGYPARHLVVQIERRASADACAPGEDRTEIDGWYIDFEFPDTKQNAHEEAQSPAGVGICRDEIRTHVVGTDKTGFPVDYTMKQSSGDTTPALTSVQVLELSAEKQDPVLFEVPAGYRGRSVGASPDRTAEGATAAASVAGKRPGGVRVAVLEAAGAAGNSAGSNRLIAMRLGTEGVDAVPVTSEQDARQYQADYLLKTDIADVKSTSPASPVVQTAAKAGRFGGLMKGMSKMTPLTAIAASATTALTSGSEAHVTYTLIPLLGGQPRSGTVTGSEHSGLNLQSSLELAQTGVGLGMMSKAGATSGFANILTNPAMNGMLANSGSGANLMMNVMNPAMMASSPRYMALSAMGTASQVLGSTPPSGGQSKALLSAFAAEAKAVSAALK